MWTERECVTIRISRLLDDRFHPHSVRQHTAFAANSRTEVDAFHAAALRAGGTDNGAPGQRRPNYYAAFVPDPDGNNIEAVFRGSLADD